MTTNNTGNDSRPLKTDSLGRVTISPEQRERMLDSFERSSMSGAAFAKLHGIRTQTFATWIQKRRRARGDYDDPAIRRRLRMGKKQAKPTESPQRPAAQQPSEGRQPQYNFIEVSLDSGEKEKVDPLELVLPNGVVIRMSSERQAGLVKKIIGELSC